jgi:pimeloyl-[acyl-carrier protein] methyl ester esterase
MPKPYLIMLPGWGMKKFIWNKLKKFLIEDFELVLVDWHEINSMDEFKKRVLDIMEKKKIRVFSLLGWSLGSLVALDIASDKSLSIENLFLIGSTSCFIEHKECEYTAGWNKKIVERMKSQLCRHPKQTLHKFYNSMFSIQEKQKNYDMEFLEMAEDSTENLSIDSLITGLDYLIQKDLRSVLPSINTPTLLIHGEKDSICTLDSGLYIKKMIPNSRIEIIKNGGHIPIFTNPKDCCNAMSQFITETI